MKLSPLVHTYLAGTSAPQLGEGALALPALPVPNDTVFGDGSHPTTRLCAGAVDFVCRTRRPRAVLDVGAGTGILARIARARGAEVVWATDIDPLALESMRAHAQLDQHAVVLQISDQLPDQLGQRFDLVVANILEGPLRALAPHLAAALAPRGQLLLSGFTRAQVPALRLHFEEQGLRFASESHLEEWVVLEFMREI